MFGGEGETYRAGYACLHGCGARNSPVSLSLGEFRPLQLFRFCRRQNVACLRRQEKRCTGYAEGECPALAYCSLYPLSKKEGSLGETPLAFLGDTVQRIGEATT